MKLRLILIFLILFTFSIEVPASWPGLFKVNQYNKEGLRHGRWIYHWDDAKKIPMNKLRFKNGKEFGLNRYYNEDGKKWLRFRALKDGRMIVTYYDEKGRKERKGEALMIYDPLEIRYCWHGKWKFYEEGKIVRTAIYNMGEEVEQ